MAGMIRHIRPILLLLGALALGSCKENTPEPHLSADAGGLAEWYCKAKLLRRDRFALADQIRFLEDSTLQTTGKHKAVFKTQVDSMYRIADSLHVETKTVAEKITRFQAELYRSRYTTTEQKALFDRTFTHMADSLCPN